MVYHLLKSHKYLKGKELSLVSLDCTHGKNRDDGTHMGFPNILEVIEKSVGVKWSEWECVINTSFIAAKFKFSLSDKE